MYDGEEALQRDIVHMHVHGLWAMCITVLKKLFQNEHVVSCERGVPMYILCQQPSISITRYLTKSMKRFILAHNFRISPHDHLHLHCSLVFRYNVKARNQRERVKEPGKILAPSRHNSRDPFPSIIISHPDNIIKL